jgi:hypothetical protein
MSILDTLNKLIPTEAERSIHAPKFFKKINAIELHDQEESRFKKLEKVIYEN